MHLVFVFCTLSRITVIYAVNEILCFNSNQNFEF